MAVKEKLRAPASVEQIELSKIVSNVSQSRGMGVLTGLQALGYGLFDKQDAAEGAEKAKEPIWTMLFHEDPAIKKQAVNMIEEHEPAFARLANSVREKGQLQPIGVLKAENGYDVIFGMRRAVCMAFNLAKHGEKCPATIEAKVFKGKISGLDLKLFAFDENDEREDESPMDRAYFYKQLMDDHKLELDDVAKRTRQSKLNVKNYLSLLHKLLEDKHLAIHLRELSVDRALKLLKKRKEHGSGTEETQQSGGSDRHRMPTMKNIKKIYDAPKKPSKMTDAEWKLWTLPDVRKFLAFKLGLRFSEWKPAPEPPKKGKATSNGEAPAAGKKGKGTIYKIKRKTAQDLLVSLGKVQARTWTDEQLVEKLEGIVNIVEPGQKAETDRLDAILQRLVGLYAGGLKVVIAEAKK